jgi:hypothetical protein
MRAVLVLLAACGCSSVLGFKTFTSDRPDGGGAGSADAAAWDANPNDLTLASILVEAPSTTSCTSTCPTGLTCDTAIGKCVVKTTITPVAGTLSYSVPSGIGVDGFQVIGYPAAQVNDVLINGTAERKPPSASTYFATPVTTGCTGSFTVQVKNPTSGNLGDLYQVANACVTGITQEAYVKATMPMPTVDAPGQLGKWVALDGDTLVTSAALDGADIGGTVFVYVRDPATRTWTFQARIRASTPINGEFFGGSLSLSGDSLAVGAWGANNYAGAVYVFVRDSTGAWTEQARLVASNGEMNDSFGGSVGISGDTLIVGAGGESSSATGINGNQSDNSADGAGAAYIFTRVGQTWSQLAYVKASDTTTAASAGFGGAVAIAGSTIVIGAVDQPKVGDPTVPAGAIYVFHESGGTWSQIAELTAGTRQIGEAVAISEDETRIVASAYGTGDAGEAYSFTNTTGFWVEENSIVPPISSPNGFFGASIGISGTTVIVGQPFDASAAKGINGDFSDASLYNAGAAWVFALDGTAIWSERAYVKASNTDAHDAFGTAVAISGDTVIVGAPGEASVATGINGDQTDNSVMSTGAVYVFQ